MWSCVTTLPVSTCPWLPTLETSDRRHFYTHKCALSTCTLDHSHSTRRSPTTRDHPRLHKIFPWILSSGKPSANRDTRSYIPFRHLTYTNKCNITADRYRLHGHKSVLSTGISSPNRHIRSNSLVPTGASSLHANHSMMSYTGNSLITTGASSLYAIHSANSTVPTGAIWLYANHSVMSHAGNSTMPTDAISIHATNSARINIYITMPTGAISLHVNHSVEQHNNIMVLITLLCYHSQIRQGAFNTIRILTTITRMRVLATQTAIRTISLILTSTT